MNKKGLGDVKELLLKLNITSSLTGPNCDGSYYLTLSKFSEINLFKNFIKTPCRK